jgi:hypothetical protein
MAYLKANLQSDKVKRVIHSKMGGYMMGGFAFLMEGESPKELEECVRYCCQAITDEGFNRNWYLSMSMNFLAEYATRYGLSPKVEKALADGLAMARQQQEETGGWCHHLRMWKEGDYNKKGGGQDLGMVTTMMYGAFLEMKALGVTLGPVMDRAQKNLESLSDGMGVRYGTDNGVGDAAMARASWVLSALLATGNTAHPFFPKYEKGLLQRYPKIDEGVHGFSPLHWFSVSAAMHRLGPEAYAKFTAEYLDRLVKSQTAEGVVPLSGEDEVASTAVFACIVLMQKPGVFVPPRQRKKPAEEPKPAAPAVVTKAEKPPAKAADPQAVAAWSDLLAERVRKEIREGRAVKFHFRVVDQAATVAALDGAGAMKIDAGGSSFDYLWKNLTLADRRDLAAALAKREDADALALAAFHYLACGEVAAGEDLLRRIPGADAERIRAGFKTN